MEVFEAVPCQRCAAEVYAMHPADHRAVVENLGLSPDPKGGYCAWAGILGPVPPSVVSDAHVTRGRTQIYETWEGYTQELESREEQANG